MPFTTVLVQLDFVSFEKDQMFSYVTLCLPILVTFLRSYQIMY